MCDTCVAAQSPLFAPQLGNGTLLGTMAPCRQNSANVAAAMGTRMLPAPAIGIVDTQEHEAVGTVVSFSLSAAADRGRNGVPAATRADEKATGVYRETGPAVVTQTPSENQDLTSTTAVMERKGEVEQAATEAARTLPACRQRQQHQHHPLGALFSPVLDKAGVVAITSEFLCRPGYTTGPEDERRLMRQIRSGRVDVRTMSRLLRWLQGERISKELLERGLRYVGPSWKVQPYTTGMGISCLLREVGRKNPAGTKIVICPSSSYDACAGTIAGFLAAPPECTTAFSPKPSSSSPRSKGTLSPDLGTNRRAASSALVAPSSSRRPGSRGKKRVEVDPEAKIVPVTVLLDERPKLIGRSPSANGSSASSDGGSDAGSAGGGGNEMLGGASGDVSEMGVHEWVKAYGECDGPMLAAWVFRGADAVEVKLCQAQAGHRDGRQ